ANLYDGNFTATNSTQAVYVGQNGGTANIYGGLYQVDSQYNGTSYVDGNGNHRFTLNCSDAAYKSGVAQINVYGGKFYMFNPANNAAEGAETNFVAEGYASLVSEISEGVNLYKVVKMSGKVTATEDMVVTKLVIPEGEELTLDLGEYTMEVVGNSFINNGTLTLKGGKVASPATEESRRNIYNYGTAVIEGTEFIQQYDQKGAAINNEGKMIIKNATVNAAYYSIWNAKEDSELVIENGTFKSTSGSAYCVMNREGAKLIINGGEYEGNQGCIGTITGAETILNKGAFKSTKHYAIYADADGYDGENTEGAIPATVIYNVDECTLTGGTYGDIYCNPTDGSSIIGMNVSNNAEEVATDLANGENVTLSDDVTASATWKMDGGILDGAGHTLSATKSETQYMIQPTGGVIKNLTISGYNARNNSGKVLRGIYLEPATDMVIENCHISGVAYPLNTGTGSVEGKTLTVKNSTLIGWTSFSGKLASATFENCKFGIGTYFESPASWNGCIKPYVNTTLTNCTFEVGFYLDLTNLIEGATVTFNQCKVGTNVITKDNFATLMKCEQDMTAKVIFQ
ncbi:MAG: hypothetical protein IJZ86_05040, partial [Bacteroides sp.]|nr:hypothetical protein [Bacteroides sp.]